jgi:hypothetical protein
MPSTMRTVADIFALAEWPAEHLRLVVERWQPACRGQDRPDTLSALLGRRIRSPTGQDGPSDRRNFLGNRGRGRGARN